MPSSAVMPVRCLIDANNLPGAMQQLTQKMAVLCPGLPFEVTLLKCEPTPKPNGNPNELGPPWRFIVEATFTLTFA